jgi:hypothetical protein
METSHIGAQQTALLLDSEDSVWIQFWKRQCTAVVYCVNECEHFSQSQLDH